MKRWPAAIIILLLWFPVRAQDGSGAQALAGWYGAQPRSADYLAVRENLFTIFSRAERAGVPGTLLVEHLDEAYAKHVAPAAAAAGLEEKLEDLIRLKAVLDGAASCLASPAGEPARDAAAVRLRQFHLLRRRNVPLAVIENVLAEACVAGKDFTAVLDALRTLANIPSLGELPGDTMKSLGRAILKSNLSPAGYTALSSFYIKGKLRNLGAREISDIIINALRDGKGLIRIEQELERRRQP